MNTYETERIFLRKIQLIDIDDVFMEWFADEELMKYYTNSRKEISKKNIIDNIEDGEKNANCFTYGIFFKGANICIGTIKIGTINWVHKISDLVVLIGNRNYHGMGLAVEAIKLGNELCFEQYDLRKLFGGMYASNLASIKAYTKAGWVIEGQLKGHYLNEGVAEDRILVGCFNPKYFTQTNYTVN